MQKRCQGIKPGKKKVNSVTVEQSGQAYAQMYTVRAYSTCVCVCTYKVLYHAKFQTFIGNIPSWKFITQRRKTQTVPL